MLILAFDTTSEYGGAAVYRDLECLAGAANEGRANYAVTLFEMVGRLMRQAGLTLRDIDLFAVANGPGSFTGIRVGVAAAQGWASAFNRPVCGVSVLEAMVEAASRRAATLAPILDARRGEFYLAVFRGGDATADFVAAGDGFLLKQAGVGPFLDRLIRNEGAGGGVACVAREQDCAVRQLREALAPSITWQEISGTLTGAVARLALRAARQGRLRSPAELDACYLRRSDAEMHWRE